ncbi:hypothetical protein D3C81_1558080 [compost metagenome]
MIKRRPQSYGLERLLHVYSLWNVLLNDTGNLTILNRQMVRKVPNIHQIRMPKQLGEFLQANMLIPRNIDILYISCTIINLHQHLSIFCQWIMF